MSFIPHRTLFVARPDEREYLYLTTIGRRTGLAREIEIWFTRRDGRYYVIAEHCERAHWVQNLLADPRIQWRLADRTFAGAARVIDAAVEPKLNTTIRALSRKKYGWEDGLVVELIPDRPA